MHLVAAVSALAALATLGTLSERIARSLRIPDIVPFLLLGMIARPFIWQMLGLSPTSFAVRTGLLLGAAVLVFEGGRSVEHAALKEVYAGGALLATVGVLVSFVVVAVASRVAFPLPWATALTAGAILAGTDPASVGPLLTEVRVVARLKDLLLLESAANDATSAALTASLLGGLGAPVAFALRLVWQLLAGTLIGGAAGFLLARAPKRGGLRALLSAPAALATYAVASFAQASGFMATFVAGAAGGARPGTGDPTLWLARVVRAAVFITLGATLNLRLLGQSLQPSLLVTLALLLVARPLSVLILLLDRPRRWTLKEIAFAAWVRETGVLPAALAAAYTASGAPGARAVTALVFMTVLLTLVVQAATARRAAALLGLLRPDLPPDAAENA